MLFKYSFKLEIEAKMKWEVKKQCFRYNILNPFNYPDYYNRIEIWKRGR